MKKFTYKDLDLYKAAKELVLSVYALLRKFLREELYALCDQLRRAVISIPSNIAEGMGCVSTKEQRILLRYCLSEKKSMILRIKHFKP